MEKKGYLLIFVAVIVGLVMGFVIAAQSYNPAIPNHALQQVTTDETGATSVDANADSKIDQVEDLSFNVQMPWDVGQFQEGFLVPAPTSVVWTQSANTRGIPNDAEYAIIEYELLTGDGVFTPDNDPFDGIDTSSGPCKTISLLFSDGPAAPGQIRDVRVTHTDYNIEESGERDQAIVPLIPGTGTYWFALSAMVPTLGEEACLYKIVDTGFIR